MTSTTSIPLSSFPVRLLRSLSDDDFANLAEHWSGRSPVLTIQMPTERKGQETRKNRIVFKNLASEAADMLGSGSGDSAVRERLEQLRELDEPTHPFWERQQDGLLLLMSAENGPEALSLPFAPETGVWLGPRGRLSTLLRLRRCRIYHVLVLDLGCLRLFATSRWQNREIPLQGIPTSLDEAMRYDDPEKSLQSRPVSAANTPGPGGGNVAFHGHGATGDETRKKKLRRFFEMIDGGLARHFHDRATPLVLLGTDTERGLYREVSHYPHLLDESIARDDNNLSEDQLDNLLREWVTTREAAGKAAALRELDERIRTGSASDDFAEVVAAAHTGRVGSIFIRAGERRYGRTAPAPAEVVVHQEREPGDDELIDAAATAAALAGADVYHIDENGDSPAPEAPLAAVMRY